MSRLILILLVLGLAGGAAMQAGSFAPNRAEHIFVKGAAHVTPAEPLAGFIADTVTEIARKSNDARPVKVNREFNRDAINVLLLDFQRLPVGLIPTPPTGLYSIRPNVLVVDVNMVRALVLNAYNDSLSFTQMLMNLSARENSDVAGADTLLDPESEGTLAFHLRLRNLRHKEVVGKFADEIASGMSGPQMQKILGLAFVFPIGHELYHLRQDARWFPRIPHLIEEEEMRADNHASKLIEQRVSGAGLEASELLNAQLSVLSMRHFQDIVLADLLHGLRDLHAEDYLAALFHRPCKQANHIPWPRRYHNPDVVFAAAQRGFPVLSQHEYERIGERLRRFSNKTHGSMLQRILKMRAAFARNENWATVVNSGFQYAEILDAAYFSSAGPAALVSKARGTTAVGDLGLDGLLEQLSAQRNWQTGAGCEHGECGLLLWRDGYMEAHLQNKAILTLRIVEPFTGDALTRTRKAVAYFFGDREAARFEREVRAFGAECRVGTFAYANGSYVLLSRVLNEDGLIETEIEKEIEAGRSESD